MSVSQVTCPECDKVLRPAKPLAAGKKVKCPKCGAAFTVEDRGPAPKAKAPAAKAAAKTDSPRPSDEDPDGAGVYRFVDEVEKEKKEAKKTKGEEEDEEEEEKKPDISYAPDMSIKDLRGPAVQLIVKPTNWLIFTGIAGFLGWIAFGVILYIPILFPLEDDKAKPALKLEHGFGESSGSFGGMMGGMPGMPGMGVGMPGMGGPQKGPAEPPPEPKEDKSFYELGSINFANLAQYSTGYIFLYTIPIILCMALTGTLTFGAVKAQNLESREWGIAGSILAMIPLTVGGISLTFSLFAQMLLNMIMDDPDFVSYMLMFFAGVLVLAGIGVGVWNLMTLMQPEVLDGFEYQPE